MTPAPARTAGATKTAAILGSKTAPTTASALASSRAASAPIARRRRSALASWASTAGSPTAGRDAPMTTRRPPDFDLEQALADPGFTPRMSDVPRLLDCVVEGGDRAELAERSLLRLGVAAGQAAMERAREAAPVDRARLTRIIGRAA